ncbi:MAG TPA: tripartite tricarboxylate transporter substrate binding protein [Casimicrobiaceae bacterium]|nr:tripartite tricarboxylate transporter substrate binding protein [Casimicrobiaceae bacterium]
MRALKWAVVLLALCSSAALAQSWPAAQPIKLIVPWPPGGGVDTTARLVAQPLAERLHQSIVVDNRPGAGGNIGTEVAARTKPDGYTLLMGSISPNAVNVWLYSRLGFDPVKDLAPIVFVSSVPNILVVPATSPFNTVHDLIEYAKANPGKLDYGSAGVGSSQHLAASIFKTAANIEIVHVPYKGTAPAESDLVGGHVQMMLDTTTCLPFIAAGKMKALAVASKARNPALPNVPTFDELGIKGVYASSWYGLMAPAGTPREVIDRVNAETNAILKTAEMKKRMTEFGAEIGGGTPEEFARFMADETKRYESVVKASGAKLD